MRHNRVYIDGVRLPVDKPWCEGDDVVKPCLKEGGEAGPMCDSGDLITSLGQRHVRISL